MLIFAVNVKVLVIQELSRMEGVGGRGSEGGGGGVGGGREIKEEGEEEEEEAIVGDGC